MTGKSHWEIAGIIRRSSSRASHEHNNQNAHKIAVRFGLKGTSLCVYYQVAPL
jgi:hypothetical protein